MEVMITKLINGDTILSTIEHTSGHTIILDPIQLMTMPTSNGGLQQVLVPWMDGTQSTEYSIPDQHVIVSAIANADMVGLYQNFLNRKKFDYVEQDEQPSIEDLLLSLLDTSDIIH